MLKRLTTDRNRLMGNALIVALGLVLLAGWMVVSVRATPMPNGTDANGNPKSALKFPSGSTINVYVEVDARSQYVKDGLQRWVAEMASRGITVNINDAPPPTPPPDNLVEVSFEPEGTQLGGHTLGTGANQDDGIGACYDDGTKLDGGKIILRDTLPHITAADQNYLRNLAQHEFCHVLGFADDSSGQVMNHTQGTQATNDLNGTDTRELKDLYPKTDQSASRAQGSTQASTNPNLYDYDFEYVPDLPSEEPGHVSLILLHVDPALILDILPPEGWIALNPADPAHYDVNTYPFYEGFAEDCASGQPLWDPEFTAPLVLRSLAEPFALSMTNPHIHVTLITQGAMRGAIDTWAGGEEIQVLEGPVPSSLAVPAAGTWGLIVLTLLILGTGAVVLRRFSKRDA